MYICNYCKKKIEKKVEIYPNCGGSSFSESAYLGETIIRKPPNGSYIVNDEIFKSRLKHIKRSTFMGIVISIAITIFFAPFILIAILIFSTPIQKDTSTLILTTIPFMIDIGIIIIIIIYNISARRKLKKEKETVKYLTKNGILVKELPFEIISSDSQNLTIKITYQNANGVKIPLTSDVKKMKQETVDLLIDPNDYSNYFIDFEIY